MADQEIRTGIDALVAYLKEHGESNISVVATALGVGEASVMEWANVLEKANVITIAHKSGRLFLSISTGTPGEAGSSRPTKESKQAEKQNVEEMISSDLAAVDQVSLDLDEFSKSIAKIDILFNTKYKNVKLILDKLNNLENSMGKVEKKLSTRSAKVKTISDEAQDRYDAAQRYLTGLSDFSLDTNNAKAVAQELKDIIKAYEKNTADLSKNLDSVIFKYRKSALDLSKTIREKHNQLVDVLSFDQRQIKEYDRLRHDYKRERDSLLRQNQQVGKKVLEEIAKGKSELESLMNASNVQMNTLKPRVEEIKKDLGSLAVLNDRLKGIRGDLDNLTKQREDILAELKKSSQGTKDGSGKMNAKMKDIEDKVTELREKTTSLRNDFANLGTTRDV